MFGEEEVKLKREFCLIYEMSLLVLVLSESCSSSRKEILWPLDMHVQPVYLISVLYPANFKIRIMHFY